MSGERESTVAKALIRWANAHPECDTQGVASWEWQDMARAVVEALDRESPERAYAQIVGPYRNYRRALVTIQAIYRASVVADPVHTRDKMARVASDALLYPNAEPPLRGRSVSSVDVGVAEKAGQ